MYNYLMLVHINMISSLITWLCTRWIKRSETCVTRCDAPFSIRECVGESHTDVILVGKYYVQMMK